MPTVEYLMQELVNVYGAIENAIGKVKAEAASIGCDASELRTPDGGWALNDLLMSKAHVLHAQVLLMQISAS